MKVTTTPKQLTNKLAGLSREEKLGLLDALDEKRRRARDRRALYKPHAGQLAVHMSKAKVRFVTSGNGFGKSTLAVQEAFWRADGFNPITGEHYPVPCNVAVILDKPSKFEEVFLTEARKWFNIAPDDLHKKGKPHISCITRPNGSVITAYSHDQDPLTWESIEVDFSIFDEPMPRACYIGMRRAGRRKGRNAKYLIIGTPLGQPWLKEELWDKWERGETTEVECFRGSTEQNAHNLADDYIESFSSALSEQERRIRLHGEWFNLEGLALAHLFRRETHIVEAASIHWKQEWPCVVAIDPHGAKPHHALLLGVDDDNQLYALKEIKLKAIPRDFARELRDWYSGYRVIDIVCDSLGSAEFSGGEGFKSFIQVLVDEGVRARATTYDDKNDEDFISRIQDVLKMPAEPDNFGRKRPKLLVSDECGQLVKDIENVQWLRIRGTETLKPKLDISHKDMLACLKYALATNLTFQRSRRARPHYVSTAAYGFDLRPKKRIRVFGKQPKDDDEDDTDW